MAQPQTPSRPESFFTREPSVPFSTAAAPKELVTIGPSVVIKGQISGQEPLYIEGTVEGEINFPDHRVTVGKAGNVTANIEAREVVVMGKLKGDIHCSEFADIRRDASVTGAILTRRIRVEEGALLTGSAEVRLATEAVEKPPKQDASHAPAASEALRPVIVGPPKARAAAAAGSGDARRVSGSSVLLEPED